MDNEVLENVKSMVIKGFPLSYVARKNKVSANQIREALLIERMDSKHVSAIMKRNKMTRDLDEINRVNGYKLTLKDVAL